MRRKIPDSGFIGKIARSPISKYHKKMQVKSLSVSEFRPHAENPRTHSPKQIRQIADSIRRFGFVNPVLVDNNGLVIAGHGRLEAAKLLGMDRVPAICVDQMTEAQKRAYIIADNKLAANAGWDLELLAHELQCIWELDSEFDLTITGFDTAEIDLMLEAGPGTGPDATAVNDIPQLDRSKPTVTRKATSGSLTVIVCSAPTPPR